MMETTAVSLTLFKSVFDNKTHRRMDLNSFSDFESLLYKLSKIPRKDKKSAELMSPAIYQPDTTRANKNVIEWSGWCAVDVDDHEFKGNLKNELDGMVGAWHYVCYSTASSRRDTPKFRLVFPLRRAVRTEDIKHFWYGLQTELGNLGDRQTKDLSRMYYIPGEYYGAHNFIFTGGGSESIDPSALMAKHPYNQKKDLNNFIDRLPEEMQRQIIEHRKSKLENTSYNWTSYRDCPFFPKHLESEYRTISSSGWYHTMYRIMVAIAANAVKKEYPITANEISQLCRQLDQETGNWYENRPMDKEADRALEFVYKNM